MKQTSFLIIALMFYPASAQAMGDPGIVYFILSAFILQLLGLWVYVRTAKKRWPIVAAIYLVFFALAWMWALDTKSVSVDTAGWLLNALPLALLLIRWVLGRKR